jgi:hypothetical protein
MRYLRILALLGIGLVPASYAHAQGVSVGIGVGGPVYDAAPVCAYGYYSYYPYACAPYGYYGPSWFSGGIFIGAGPWYRGGFYGRPGFRPFVGGGFRPGVRSFGPRGSVGGFRGGAVARGPVGGFRGGNVRGGFSGGNVRGGGSFRGGSGGGGFHGGGGSHGGGGHR